MHSSIHRVSLSWAAICLVVCLPVCAEPSSEVLSAGARDVFVKAIDGRELPRFRQGEGEAGGRAHPGAGLADSPLDKFMKEHSRVLSRPEDGGQASAAALKDVDLSVILNRHLKTSLKYNLGGKDIWISGAFDRAQNAYVSVFEDGKEARFFNVQELLKSPQILEIGTGKFKLSLSPDLSDQLESEIVLTNTANKKDQQRITLREMLAAVSAAGEEVRLTGQVYRLFYYDDIKDGKADKTSKSFAFMLTDAQGEINVFLVPADLVPADKIAIFKMYQDKRVGLQQAGGKLKIFENL